MDCRNAEDLLERLADSEDTFAHAGSSTKQDERVNDGSNYAGCAAVGDPLASVAAPAAPGPDSQRCFSHAALTSVSSPTLQADATRRL